MIKVSINICKFYHSTNIPFTVSEVQKRLEEKLISTSATAISKKIDEGKLRPFLYLM